MRLHEPRPLSPVGPDASPAWSLGDIALGIGCAVPVGAVGLLVWLAVGSPLQSHDARAARPTAGAQVELRFESGAVPRPVECAGTSRAAVTCTEE